MTMTVSSGYKRKVDQSSNTSKFDLQSKNHTESIPFGKALSRWSDVVCQQHVIPTVLHSTGLNSSLRTQIAKSFDAQGRCLSCPNKHSVLEGEVIYLLMGDQHVPAVLKDGAV